MKISETVPKGFNAVNFFRKIKNKISKETYGLTNDQIKEYYKDANKDAFLIRLKKLKKSLISSRTNFNNIYPYPNNFAIVGAKCACSNK